MAAKKEETKLAVTNITAVQPAPQASTWRLTLSGGRVLKIPSATTQEMLSNIKESLAISDREWEAFLAEQYEEVSQSRRAIPIIRPGKVTEDGDAQFVIILGLLDSRDAEQVKPIPIGKKLYVVISHTITRAALYGDENGTKQGKGDLLRCMAFAPMMIPNRNDDGIPRAIEPTVVFETIWGGERRNCANCPKSRFNNDDCKETPEVMCGVFSPVPVADLGGNMFPAMLHISPTGIGNFRSASMNPQKAGFLTRCSSQRMPVALTVARLTLEIQSNDMNSWGVPKWEIATKEELQDIGHGELLKLATQFRFEIKADMPKVKDSALAYSQMGDIEGEDDEERARKQEEADAKVNANPDADGGVADAGTAPGTAPGTALAGDVAGAGAAGAVNAGQAAGAVPAGAGAAGATTGTQTVLLPGQDEIPF